MIDNILLNNHSKFQIHQIIMITHSLITVNLASEMLCVKINEILEKFNYEIILTDMLLFQILHISLHSPLFSLKCFEKYFILYNNFVKKYQINNKHICFLIKLMSQKLKTESNEEKRQSLKLSLDELRRYVK